MDRSVYLLHQRTHGIPICVPACLASDLSPSMSPAECVEKTHHGDSSLLPSISPSPPSLLSHSNLVNKLLPLVHRNHAVLAPLRSLLSVLKPVLEHSHQSTIWSAHGAGVDKNQLRPILPTPSRQLSPGDASLLVSSRLLTEPTLGSELAEQNSYGLNRACVVHVGMLLHEDIRILASLAMWSSLDATVVCLSHLIVAIENAPEDISSEAAIDGIMKLLNGTCDKFAGQRAHSMLFGVATRDVRYNRGLIDIVNHPRLGTGWRKLLTLGVVALIVLQERKLGSTKFAEWRARNRDVARSVVIWADGCSTDASLASGTVALLEKIMTVFGSHREDSGGGQSQSNSR